MERDPSDANRQNEAYFHAEQAEVSAVGALLLVGKNKTLNAAFAPGQWRFVYAASTSDGSAVAAERWPGQMDDPRGTTS